MDTWDTLYRWREEGELRDRTVEATWERVSSAIARHDTHFAHWAPRYAEAFRRWRVLPDARLLRSAGTSKTGLRIDKPRATLNLGSFVTRPQAAPPSFDWNLLFDTAKLAVRMLDDTLLTFPSNGCGIHVGVMGFADALAKLGVCYTDGQACDLADQVGRTLSKACYAASSELLAERGPFDLENTPSIAYGPGSARRHSYLTCIISQPSLAQFANQSSDALDPLLGSAWDLASRWATGVEKAAMELEPLLLQQIEIRARLQPWVDLPIAYPLVYSGTHPSDKTVERCREHAQQCGLPSPIFRKSELPLSGLG